MTNSATPGPPVLNKTNAPNKSEQTSGNTPTVTRHATAIAVGNVGVIIHGPSGSGKSSLALRALDHTPNAYLAAPVVLISDDQVILDRRGDEVFASSPATIRGKLEVRGIGIVDAPHTTTPIPVNLLVRLTHRAEIERLPAPLDQEDLLGVPFNVIKIDPEDPAAVAKLLVAARQLDRTR